jgi:hypothetical protein
MSTSQLTSATHTDLFYTNPAYTNLFHEHDNMKKQFSLLQCVICLFSR